LAEGTIERPEPNCVQVRGDDFAPARDCAFSDLIAAQGPEQHAGRLPGGRRPLAHTQEIGGRQADPFKEVSAARAARASGIEGSVQGDLAGRLADLVPMRPLALPELAQGLTKAREAGGLGVCGRKPDREIEADHDASASGSGCEPREQSSG
jgi:hypothetical protein